MPAKKKPEKSSGKASKKTKEEDSTPVESAADILRKDGVVATFALNAKKIHRNVRDITVSNLTVTYHGSPIVEEAELSLNYGNRSFIITSTI